MEIGEVGVAAGGSGGAQGAAAAQNLGVAVAETAKGSSIGRARLV